MKDERLRHLLDASIENKTCINYHFNDRESFIKAFRTGSILFCLMQDNGDEEQDIYDGAKMTEKGVPKCENN